MGLEHSGVASSTGASLMEVSAFMTEQLKGQLQLQRDHDEKVRASTEAKLQAQKDESDAQRKEAAAKLEAQKQEAEMQRKEADAQRQAMETKVEALRNDAMEARVRDTQLQLEKQREEAEAHKTDKQITALQARLEALHAAKLLADEELFALEDAIADALEAPDDDDRTARMVALSGRMAADAAFSRQLRRKFVQ